MTVRIDYVRIAPGAVRAMFGKDARVLYGVIRLLRRRSALRWLLGFEQCLKPQQPRIPKRAQVFDPLLQLAQWLWRKRITPFTPGLLDGHQAGALQDREVLEHTLPSDRVVSRKLRRRPRALFRQFQQQAAAHWVGQRGKDRLLVVDLLDQHRHSHAGRSRSYAWP